MSHTPVDPFAATSSPRRLPLSYPGTWPEFSSLISQSRLWQIRDRHGDELSWERISPCRLGECRVQLDEQLALSPGSAPELATVLEAAGAVSLDDRVPVLAIGSNAAPAQLRHKFEDRDTPLLIPSVRARVDGVQLGFTAFLAPAGYVPATIYPEAGNTVELAVQWLDVAQLREIDATELPYYRRVWLDASQGVRVLLETGEVLPGVHAYVAEGGMLGRDGVPWVLGAGLNQRPTSMDPARWFADQEAVIAALQASTTIAAELGTTAAQFIEARHSGGDRAELLIEAGFVIADNRFGTLAPQTAG